MSDKLVRAIAQTMVRQCKGCHGAGKVMVAMLDSGIKRVDCLDCATLRKALEEEE